MYSREYAGRELRFEPSGGLLNSSLVMQDKETDSYWSIMTGVAIGGEFEGTDLRELPVSQKVRWDDWRERHPDTLVLSVGGREHTRDQYQSYWRDRQGFRGQRAKDNRLRTKEPIYAFEYGGVAYAAPTSVAEGGATFALDDGPHVFLWRTPGAGLFEGTEAYVSQAGFERRDGAWVEIETGARFDEETGRFGGGQVEPFVGFDTFWYTWSLNREGTVILE